MPKDRGTEEMQQLSRCGLWNSLDANEKTVRDRRVRRKEGGLVEMLATDLTDIWGLFSPGRTDGRRQVMVERRDSPGMNGYIQLRAYKRGRQNHLQPCSRLSEEGGLGMESQPENLTTNMD